MCTSALQCLVVAYVLVDGQKKKPKTSEVCKEMDRLSDCGSEQMLIR